MKTIIRHSQWIPLIGIPLVFLKPIGSMDKDPYFDLGFHYWGSAVWQALLISGLLIMLL